MARTGKITIQQGVGKTSGKPYSALKLSAGKWSQLHFPTQFEADYLNEYLKTSEGSFTLDQTTNKLQLVAGDYVYQYAVESPFELKYLTEFLLHNDPAEPAVQQSLDNKLDLDKEDELPGDFSL